MPKGRNRKIVPREANGRAQRPPEAETEAAATHVAREARIRVLGLPKRLAMASTVATPVGRMLESGMLGKIGEGEVGTERYNVALGYIRRHARMLSALDAPERVIEPPDGTAKPCETCGASARCPPCQAEAAQDALVAWDEIQALMTVHERAVMRTVLIAELEQPMAGPLVVRCLDRIRAHYAARQKARAA